MPSMNTRTLWYNVNTVMAKVFWLWLNLINILKNTTHSMGDWWGALMKKRFVYNFMWHSMQCSLFTSILIFAVMSESSRKLESEVNHWQRLKRADEVFTLSVNIEQWAYGWVWPMNTLWMNIYVWDWVSLI